MTRVLYILRFRHEELIKIGFTIDVTKRIYDLGGSFDLAESYIAISTDSKCVRLIERSLHAIFAKHSAESLGEAL